MFDMMKMMGKLKEVQASVKKAQEELSEIKASADSGGGMVQATVNGNKEVISLIVDDSLVNKEDATMMNDLIIAAINKALKDVDAEAKAHLQKATAGSIPNIPGFDLNNMM